MAFCKNCGTQLADTDTICPRCGEPQTAVSADKGGFLWGLLGCCIPLVGLILFLVWKDTKPKTAKAAGIGALVCVIAYVVLYVLLFALGLGTTLLIGSY